MFEEDGSIFLAQLKLLKDDPLAKFFVKFQDVYRNHLEQMNNSKQFYWICLYAVFEFYRTEQASKTSTHSPALTVLVKAVIKDIFPQDKSLEKDLERDKTVSFTTLNLLQKLMMSYFVNSEALNLFCQLFSRMLSHDDHNVRKALLAYFKAYQVDIDSPLMAEFGKKVAACTRDIQDIFKKLFPDAIPHIERAVAERITDINKISQKLFDEKTFSTALQSYSKPKLPRPRQTNLGLSKTMIKWVEDTKESRDIIPHLRLWELITLFFLNPANKDKHGSSKFLPRFLKAVCDTIFVSQSDLDKKPDLNLDSDDKTGILKDINAHLRDLLATHGVTSQHQAALQPLCNMILSATKSKDTRNQLTTLLKDILLVLSGHEEETFIDSSIDFCDAASLRTLELHALGKESQRLGELFPEQTQGGPTPTGEEEREARTKFSLHVLTSQLGKKLSRQNLSRNSSGEKPLAGLENTGKGMQ